MALPVNQLGGATWTNPLALPGSKPVNATNTTTPVTSKSGTLVPITPFNGSGASGSWEPAPSPAQSAPQVTYNDNSGQAAPVTPYVAQPAYVDPYSNTVFGSTENFNRIHGDWTGQRDATMSSITDRINNDYAGYDSSVKDFGANVKTGQQRINDSYVQNELSKVEGARGVQDMVGTGVRSAGVIIGNRPGASTSSARDAIARAYSMIGQREMNKVGNQYEKGLHEIGGKQGEFNDQVSMDARHLTENKTKIVNDIATEAASKIAALNAAAASASLDDRLDIEGEKARVRNEALTTLSQLDQVITAHQAQARPTDRSTWQAEATKLANAGVAPVDPFSFNASTPAQFENTGPFEGDLPLFNLPPKKNQT